ncbi:MAG: 30S ribosomal protein S15 [Nanoarchaeota archaeon]
MARMHSRKKGKSGSAKPMKRSASWVKLKPAEIEEIIVKLAKKGDTSSQIGIELRDSYGIPSVNMFTKTKIAKIMKKNDVYSKFPEDMFSLMKKAVSLHAHMDKNKKDYTSKRGLELTESKIRRLVKYYRSEGTIPKDWKYEYERAKLLVK